MDVIHFVTGATGFVGSNLVLELLQRPDTEIYALARPAAEPAETRLQSVLRHAARAAGYEDSLDQAILDRCHAVAGDVHNENCGVGDESFPRPDQFWHIAASLRYEDRYAAEIFRTNVEGTRNAIALARRCGVTGNFNYVSTAYVSGLQMGLIREEVSSNRSGNNPYEQTKMEAEGLVHQCRDLHSRVFRPSIVIGHSVTRVVSSGFSGFYGFVRRVLRLRQLLERIQEGLSSRAGLRVIVDPAARMNLIPVDVATRQMVRIAESHPPETIFHVTNPAAPLASDVARVIFSELELQLPILVTDDTGMNWIDRKIEEGLGFYKCYFRGSRQFDRRNSDRALGSFADDPGYRMDSEAVAEYVRWYSDVLRRTTNLLPGMAPAFA